MSFDLLLEMARGRVPFERIKVTGGQTGGHLKIQEGQKKKNVTVDRTRKGSGYATKYQLQDQEEDEIDELPYKGPLRRGKTMAAVEDLTSQGTFPEDPRMILDDPLRVYREYSFDHEPNTRLLINDYKDTILAQIEANSVVIVKGPTGCGKSTQVPQYILDDARSRQIHCNIVITQPRRIAASSVARRVCEERRWNLGSLVGYQISLEKKATNDTRLLYCTAGVLLQQLIGNQNLSMYTHIIIDEVHERDNETDFLLIVIKKLMRLRGNRTKLILMSATINTDKFVRYFSKNLDSNNPFEPPVLELAQEQRFLVQEYYLEDLSEQVSVPDVCFSDAKICPTMYQLVGVLLGAFATIDAQDHKQNPFLGSVLVFLPGIHEIETLYSILNAKMESNTVQRNKRKEEWILCPLHSTMSFDDQMNVFKKAPSGKRKIILATNIAESSITVADVKYVIDFCLTKHQVLDKDTLYPSLQLAWVSKSQAIQRAGRVGRTMPGRVYRLIPRNMYNEDLAEDCAPEILRCPLDQLVLKAKKLDFGPPVSILGSAMDPPDLTNIQRTILNLKEVGALTLMIDGQYDEEDGDLTFIGTVMESLPLDIQLSKLIILGHMLSVLRECVIMACCMSGKEIFTNPFGKKLEAFNNRLAWANGSASDPLTYLAVYMVWKKSGERGKYHRTGGETEQQWANRNFVNLRALKDVERLEVEVIGRLEKLGIRDSKIPTVGEQMDTSEDLRPILLKIAIAGAFYPNYFTHTPIDEREAVKTLGGRDPCKTVYLTKFPQNQPGPLYRDFIKKLFAECGSNIKVQFDGSAKAYIEFGDSVGQDYEGGHFGSEEAVPGRVMKAVYRAIKLRHLNMPMHIPMLPAPEAARRAKEIFGDSLNPHSFHWKKNPAPPSILRKRAQMPGLSEYHMVVSILHIVDPHNFYVMKLDAYTTNSKYLWIDKELNSSNDGVLLDLDPGALIPDLPCVAPFSSGPHDYPRYYRAKVLQVEDRARVRARVFFIDYGNVESIETSLIKDYGPNLVQKGIRDEPPFCIKCRLAEVQPLAYKQAQHFDQKQITSVWCSGAIDLFTKRFPLKEACVKIYSTVNDTMAVYIFDRVTSSYTDRYKLSNESSFNHELVVKGFARFMEEPYLSKENNALREKYNESPEAARNSLISSVDQYQEYLDDLVFKPPTEKEAHFTMKLQGPKSPLEMSISSITRKCVGKSAGVDFNSVNSVLLDTNPMDTSSRLIVAGTVTQNGGRLTLRNTTIMPSMRGIVGIMCLISTPKAELRVDPTRSFVTGALCGLGSDEEGVSYDQENDIEVAFDCKFDMTDVELINKIRFWMNDITCGVATSPEQQAVSRSAASYAQTKIVKYLLSLLSKPRDPLCPMVYDRGYEWNEIDEEYLLDPSNSKDDSLLVYRLIWGVELQENSNEAQIESLKKHLKKLNMYAKGSESMRNVITCEFCQVYFESPQAIAIHIKTAVHKNQEKRMLGVEMPANDESGNNYHY